MKINLKDKVELIDCPDINGVVIGMHCEDFSNDIPVIVKESKYSKLIAIPYSQLRLVKEKEN